MYTLFLGDYAYSSWSLRGWLLLDAFGQKFERRHAHMRTPEFEALRVEMAPARLVPALRIDEGAAPLIVWDTLAIAETLAERHPGAGHWPADPAARATARALAAEMHSGFQALRRACPMNFYRRYAGFRPDDDVRAELARLSAIWAHARGFADGDGPWLFGAFSAADAFFAPVASRIETYGLEMAAPDLAYVAALIKHPSVRRWAALAEADGHVQPHYEFGLPARAAAG